MVYSSQRDREMTSLEYTQTPWPLSPLNLIMTRGDLPGVVDLRWDDPSILTLNSRFRLLGVNLYRAFDSEYGPFERITQVPVGATFWRDQTDNEVIIEEDVTSRLELRNDSTSQGGPHWVFRTLYPIVREGSQAVYSNSPDDIQILIDGKPARALYVSGFSGEVELDSNIYADVARQKLDPALVPGPNSRVTCSYRRNRSLLKTDLGQRVFYRVTAVGYALDDQGHETGELVETPLENSASTSLMEVEKLDYMWREAVRRNRFILEQGGERVRVMLRKNVGVPCVCFQDDYHHQPLNDCTTCYGTGVVGGYEGPYDTIIAPDDGDRRISQKDTGRTLEHSYEVWTGPHPLLSQRDFVIKINGDRYSIGPVRFPSNRGMVLQQHFTIGHLDEKDIRYRVPLGSPVKFSAIEFAPSGPELEADASPTDRADIPAERQLRGRTPVWRNTE